MTMATTCLARTLPPWSCPLHHPMPLAMSNILLTAISYQNQEGFLLINLRSAFHIAAMIVHCSTPCSSQNKSNYDAHFDGTGPEIWRQTNGRVDAFVSGAGDTLTSFSNSCLSHFIIHMRFLSLKNLIVNLDLVQELAGPLQESVIF